MVARVTPPFKNWQKLLSLALQKEQYNNNHEDHAHSYYVYVQEGKSIHFTFYFVVMVLRYCNAELDRVTNLNLFYRSLHVNVSGCITLNEPSQPAMNQASISHKLSMKYRSRLASEWR